MSDESNTFKLPQEKKFSFWQKISWRLNFLFFEPNGLDWEIKKLFLFASANKRISRIADHLIKKGIINLDRNKQLLKYGDFSFFYDKHNGESHLFGEFLSIFSNESPELKKFLFCDPFGLEGPYEIEEIKILPGDYVIDAGANAGLFSVLASAKTGSGGKVFAFEPIKESAELLKKNIEINKISNIKIEIAALGKTNDKLELIKPDFYSGCSGFFSGDFPKETATQVTLDDYVRINNLKKVDFIKADIEGMERDLLMGGRETIKKFKPKLAICTYHRGDDPEYLEALIKSYVPEYKIIKTEKKLFALV